MRINIVQTKVGVFAIFSLFVIMMSPAYANVTSLSLEESHYTVDENFRLIGTQDGKDVVYIIIRDATGSFMGMLADPTPSSGEFDTFPKPVTNFFSLKGIYKGLKKVTNFIDAVKKVQNFAFGNVNLNMLDINLSQLINRYC